MAAKRQYVVVTYVCVLLFVALTEAQSIYFGLHQEECNEVILVGEMNINMTCSSSRSPIIGITIEHGGTVIANTQGMGNYLNYSIEKVMLQDGGNYKCTITYITGVTVNVTEFKNLYLNVHDSKSPQCVNNGTDDDYNVGDVLLLTCYCFVSYNCTWIETIEGSGTANQLNNVDTCTFVNKQLIILLVGPFTTEDNNKRFDCYRGVSADQRCSVGPLDLSTLNSTDVVSELPDTSQLTSGEPSHSSSTRNIENTFTFVNTYVTTENPMLYETLPIWIIGAAIVSFLAIISILCFTVFLLKRNMKNNNNIHDKPRDNKDKNYNNKTFINDSEDAYTFQAGDVSHYDISRANVHDVEMTSSDNIEEVLDISKLYSTVNEDTISEIKEMNIQHYETSGEDVQDLYAKVDKNRHMSKY